MDKDRTNLLIHYVFEGLDASVTCVVYQNGKSSFVIGGDDDGGGADNTYD